MNKKFKRRIMLILAIFVLLVAIPMSFATDVGDSDSIATDSYELNEQYNGSVALDGTLLGLSDIIYVSPSGSGTGASPTDPTSLSDGINNKVNDGGTVILLNGTYNLGARGITISKNVNLLGSGSSIIVGSFSINGNTNEYAVTFQDLIFQNSYPTNVINFLSSSNKGTLNITDCIFTNIQASNSIITSGAKNNYITGCSFSNNVVTGNSGSVIIINAGSSSSTMNYFTVNNNVFAGNNVKNGIFSKNTNTFYQLTADYNYYGTNSKPSDSQLGVASAVVTNWVIMSTDCPSTIYQAAETTFNIILNQYTDGTNNYTLSKPLAPFTISLNATSGDFYNDSYILSNGQASVTYMTLIPGNTVVDVYVADDLLYSFTTFVSDDNPDNLHVATNGNDITGDGSATNPYATLAKAVSVNEQGVGGRFIFIHAGSYSNTYATITKKVYIYGKDGIVTLLGNNNPILDISSNADVIIRDIKFTNTNGIAIKSNESNLDIANCLFDQNTIAINLDGSTLLSTNNNFTNNINPTANMFDSSSAINARTSDITIISNSFLSNEGNIGGAIYTSESNLNIVDSIFGVNQGRMGGSAIATVSTYLTVTNTNFTANHAENWGGAIFQHMSDGLISDCIFESNTAGHGVSGASGGAIQNQQGSLTIEYCIFLNNKISGTTSYGSYGGAIANSAQGMDTSIEVYDSYFEGNSGYNGGAISSTTDGTAYVSAYIANCNFTRNVASDFGSGSGVYNLKGYLNVDSCNFDENSADVGTLFNENGQVEIYSTNFNDNTAQSAGAIRNVGLMYIEYCRFINNHATSGSAGSIYSVDTTDVETSLVIFHSVLVNNTATESAGAIYDRATELIANYNVFLANTASGNGKQVLVKNGVRSVDLNDNYWGMNNKPNDSLVYLENTVPKTGFKNWTVFGCELEKGNVINITQAQYVYLYIWNITDGTHCISIDELDQQMATVYMYIDAINPVEENEFIMNYDQYVGYSGATPCNDSMKIYMEGVLIDTEKITVNPPTGVTNLILETSSIEYGESLDITATLEEDASGYVLFMVGDYYESVPIVQGIAMFSIPEIDAGNYTITASYSGDTQYAALTNTTTVEVRKKDSTLTIESQNFTYSTSDRELLKFFSSESTIISFNITGNGYLLTENVSVTANKIFEYPCNMLNAGTYTVTALLPETTNIKGCTATSTFVIYQQDTLLTVSVSDIDYWKDEEVTVHINSTAADGTVYVTVGNLTKSTTISKQRASVIFYKLPAGNYTAFVQYEGNTNYKASNITSTLFTVAKITPSISVTTSNIKYGENETVLTKLSYGNNPTNPTGNITYVLTNQLNRTVALEAAQAEYTYSNLSAGNYTLIVIYSGDSNHNSVTKEVSFIVSRYTPLVILDVVGNATTRTANVTATFSPKVPEQATFKIDGNVFTTVEIVDGKAVCQLTNIAKGSHTIEVIYQGNRNFNFASASTTFNFDQVKTTINLTISNSTIPYDKTATATVQVTEGAYGNVKFISNIAGEIGTVELNNSAATINLSNLAIGTHIITAQFLGNDDFAPSTTNKTITITKMNIALTVNNTVFTYGDQIIVTVTANSTNMNGNGIITVNNENHTVTFNNGVAKLTLSDLNAGSYPVNVKYVGNELYNEATGNGTITINKANYDIDVTVTNISYGESEVINVNVNPTITGTVTFTLNDVSTNVTINQGVASKIYTGLTGGDYTFVVTVPETTNYKNTSSTKQFKVARIASSTDLSITNITYGVNEDITVTVTSGATGDVLLQVGNTEYTITLVNGTAIKSLKLNAGTYTVIATYLGDSNYDSSSVNDTLVVSKNPNPMTADFSVSGKNVIVNVTLPTDATGNVVVRFNNQNYNVTMVDGKGSLIIPNVPDGHYVTTVTYYGDNDYASQIITGEVTVDADIKLTVNKLDKYFRQEKPLTGTLTFNNGAPIVGQNVIISISGLSKNYTKTTDSKGMFSLNINLEPGIYSVIVIYNGSYGYAQGVSVINVYHTIEANDLTMYYNNGSVFKARFLDINGNALYSKKVVFEIDGKSYTKTTDNLGYASQNINLGPGDYTIKVTNTVTTESLTYNVHVLTTINAKDLTLYYKNGSSFEAQFLNGHGNPLKNTNVQFKIVGSTYTKTTDSNGVAGLRINLAPGDYTITAVNTNGEQKTYNIHVLSTINASDLTMAYKNGSFEAQFLDGQGEPLKNTNVQFKIVGSTYTKTTDANGVASLRINLGVGDYTITAINANGEQKTYNVHIVPAIIDVVADDLTLYYKNGSSFEATFYINGELMKNTNVQFKIVGATYTKTTDDNGVASLRINLAPGDYPITVVDPNGKEYTYDIHVLSTINASDLTMAYKSGAFEAQFLDGQGEPLKNTDVQFKIVGSTYTKTTDANGVASLRINLGVGDYTITAVHANGEQKTYNVHIVPAIIKVDADDLTLYYKNGSSFEAKFLVNDEPLKNTNVQFKIVGATYTKTTDDNGVASLRINLAPGDYPITVVDPNGKEYTYDIHVLSTINASDLTMAYKSGAFEAQFLDGQGEPLKNTDVQFKIVGSTYTRTTDANGIARLNINLPVGDYTITAVHANGEQKTYNVHIVPAIIDVVADDLTLYYKNGSSFEATFYRNGELMKNTNVQFKIVGATYTKTTDDNGVASLRINLAPGDYPITVVDPNGKEYTYNVHVLSTIVAKDITMYYKSGAFEAQFLDGQGNPLNNTNVQFSIVGKTYSRTTDANGVASMNINLEPGKYSITPINPNSTEQKTYTVTVLKK